MKYLVLKNEDIEKYLSEPELRGFCECLDVIKDSRQKEGKRRGYTYLIVNTDESYAGDIADIIEINERKSGRWEHGEKSLREVMGISRGISELAKTRRALELACQFSIAPEQSMKNWLDQAEKEDAR